MHWLYSLLKRLSISNPYTSTVGVVTYCGTEKVEVWRTVVRYNYSFQSQTYEGVKLYAVKSQMEARLLADKLVRQYPIASEHSIQVHKEKPWLSKLS